MYGGVPPVMRRSIAHGWGPSCGAAFRVEEPLGDAAPGKEVLDGRAVVRGPPRAGLRCVVHERVHIKGDVRARHDAVLGPAPLLEDPLEQLRHDPLTRRGGMQIVEEVLGEVSGLIRRVRRREDGRHIDVGKPVVPSDGRLGPPVGRPLVRGLDLVQDFHRRWRCEQDHAHIPGGGRPNELLEVLGVVRERHTPLVSARQIRALNPRDDAPAVRRLHATHPRRQPSNQGRLSEYTASTQVRAAQEVSVLVGLIVGVAPEVGQHEQGRRERPAHLVHQADGLLGRVARDGTVDGRGVLQPPREARTQCLVVRHAKAEEA